MSSLGTIGFVGTGRMGSGLIRRILNAGGNVAAYDRSEPAKEAFVGSFTFKDSLRSLVSALGVSNRIIWLMVPAGAPVDSCIEEILPLLTKGDILIDGGNSNFHDSVRRYSVCTEVGVSFLDVGTSGGVWGEKKGFCMMVGGDKASYERLSPFLKVLCTEDGFSYMGEAGSGHYVKMIHNAIEYGLMQAYGEGIDLLENAPYELSIRDVVKVWNRGGVIRSWLLELGESMLEQDEALSSLEPYIDDSGTGRWAVEESLRANVPTPVLTTALYSRFSSRRTDSMSFKFIAGLRKAFGGHAVKTK